MLTNRATPVDKGGMDGVTSPPALRTLGHPDQSVAHLSPSGLTLVWADGDRVRIAADAIEMSLAWQLPALYTVPAGDGAAAPSFRFIRVGADGGPGDAEVRDLTARRDATWALVPGHIAELTRNLSEVSANRRKAEQRREELKALLQAHAPTLAGVPEARMIVGLRRRMATLELDRKGQVPVELGAIRTAYEALLGIDAADLPTDPDAADLATRWESLLADEARLDQTDARHPLTDQLLALQSKLRLAELTAATALEEVNRPRPTPADLVEIERLHSATEEAEERASRRGGRKGEAQAREDARAAEEAFLGRFGFQSYSEYLLAGALDPPAAAIARHEQAEQKVAALKAMIADLQDNMAPSAARAALLERADRLAAEIATRFSEIDLGDDDVAGALRQIRRPPQEWHDLVAALQVEGHEPTDDPMAVAHRLLNEAREQNRPIEAIEAELAELRERLAALDPAVLAQHGSIGTLAAELIKVEQACERLEQETTDLRTRLAAELEQEPGALSALDAIQQLDRELAARTAGAAPNGSGDGDGNGNGNGNGSGAGPADAAGTGRELSQQLEAAVAKVRVGPGEPVIVALEGRVDPDAPGLRAEMAELVERLVELSAGRQLIVVTPIEPLVTAAGERGGVALATFDTP